MSTTTTLKANTRYLTGITTSGTPHLGNYVGSIRPAVSASRQADFEGFYFLADYHALIKISDPERITRSTLEIAATWLACGLDPEKVYFYRQSDIPEITQLCWLLTCVAGKGMLNRAHAYKAHIDKNLLAHLDADTDVTAGLFMYPILMAADILMFNAHKVPVGRDQIQHIEMTRDVAASFNHRYGELFHLPEAVIDDQVATLVGLDGRKMSKSYDNTIPLFCSTQALKKQIFSILTDSKTPQEPKDTEKSALFQMYQAFANQGEVDNMRKAYANGIGWGEVKQQLYECIDREIAPLRNKYQALMDKPAQIEHILQQGAEKTRNLSREFFHRLKNAIGLRALTQPPQTTTAPSIQYANNNAQTPIITLKQYKGEDGFFYFKLQDEKHHVLAQSIGFTNPKEAAPIITQLKDHQFNNLSSLAHFFQYITDGKITKE